MIYLDPQSIIWYMQQQGIQRSIPYLITVFYVPMHKLKDVANLRLAVNSAGRTAPLFWNKDKSCTDTFFLF